MHVDRILFFLILFNLPCWIYGQPSPRQDTVAAPRGAWARMEVVNGDTVFAMTMRQLRVVARRDWRNRDEQIQYYKYMRAARNVYPYALQAVAMYREIQQETADMRKGQRRRFIRREHRELKADFSEQMKGLSRTEGKVLIKMIEKELEKPFYDLIRETRGGITATYWHNLSKIYDYDLKQGYQVGRDTLLDDVLIDYDFGRPAWND